MKIRVKWRCDKGNVRSDDCIMASQQDSASRTHYPFSCVRRRIAGCVVVAGGVHSNRALTETGIAEDHDSHGRTIAFSAVTAIAPFIVSLEVSHDKPASRVGSFSLANVPLYWTAL